MKNNVFWAVAACISCLNRRFGGTAADWQPPAQACSSLADFSTLKMEAISTFETSVHARSARRYIPEDGILQDKSLVLTSVFASYSYLLSLNKFNGSS
jgi:hypothetical protein